MHRFQLAKDRSSCIDILLLKSCHATETCGKSFSSSNRHDKSAIKFGRRQQNVSDDLITSLMKIHNKKCSFEHLNCQMYLKLKLFKTLDESINNLKTPML